MMWYSTRFLPVKHNTQLKLHPYKRSITIENMYTFVQGGKDLKQGSENRSAGGRVKLKLKVLGEVT